MCKFFGDKIKKFNCLDMQFIKLATVFFTFVIVKGVRIIWNVDLPDLLSIWWWLVLMIIFMFKPLHKIYKKNERIN